MSWLSGQVLRNLRSTALPVVLEVGLSTDFVHIVRTGWGAPAQWHLPCLADPAAPAWQSAVATLAAWLASQNDGRTRHLRVRVSGRWAHWQLMPWRADAADREERQALAGLRFREQFGGTAAQWKVALSDTPPGRNTPAVAIEVALLDALQTQCNGPKVRLLSVEPYFASAFDRWRRRGVGQTGWFAALESDAITFGLVHRGQWECLHAQTLDGDWQQRLPGLLHIAGLACDAGRWGTAPLPLHIAGDLSSPPLPIAELRERVVWDWLGLPLPRGLEAMPGLRLALGA